MLIPRDKHAHLPTVPIHSLEGRFTHPAYGTAELCQLPPSGSRHHVSQASPSCQAAFKISHLLNDILPPSKGPRLVSHFPRLWGTHFVFTHFTNNTFNVTLWNHIQPTDNPMSRDKSEDPFILPVSLDQDVEPPNVTFDVDEEGRIVGLGFRGIWGPGDGVPLPKGNSIQARSDAWFRRI